MVFNLTGMVKSNAINQHCSSSIFLVLILWQETNSITQNCTKSVFIRFVFRFKYKLIVKFQVLPDQPSACLQWSDYISEQGQGYKCHLFCISVKPLTWSSPTSFSLNWREMASLSRLLDTKMVG